VIGPTLNQPIAKEWGGKAGKKEEPVKNLDMITPLKNY